MRTRRLEAPNSLYVQRSPENRVQGRNHAIYVAVKITASVYLPDAFAIGLLPTTEKIPFL